MVRRAGLVFVFLLSSLSVSAPADAAEGGLIYRSRSTSVVGPGRAAAKVTCPRGTKVISGGGRSLGSTSLNAIQSSAPFDGRDRDRKRDDGWFVSAVVRADVGGVRVTAICAKRGSFRYVKSSAPVGTGRNPHTTPCPAGTKVTGGGAELLGSDPSLRLAASIPGDGSSTVDDGWHVDASNTGPAASMRTHAICTEASGFSYDIGSGSIGIGISAGTGSGCPAGSIVAGGGGKILGTSTAAHINQTEPTDFFSEPDDRPDDFWTFIMFNGTGAVLNFRDAVICKSIT